MKERVEYISGVKSIGFFMVMITHFIASECPEVFKYWVIGESNIAWFCAVFKGKIGVTIFCVASGFLAAHAVNVRRVNISDSIIKRYSKFMMNILIVNMLYYIIRQICLFFNLPSYYGNDWPFSFFILDGIFLLGQVNPPLWVIGDLFLGYLICLLMTHYFKNYKYRYMVFFATLCVMFLCNKIWLFSIVLGMVLNVVYNDKHRYVIHLCTIQKNRVIIILKFILAYFLYIRSESAIYAYIGYGIASFLFLSAINDSKIVNKIFSNKYLLILDNYSFEAYLLHIWELFFVIPVIKMIYPKMSAFVLFAIYAIILAILTIGYKKGISSKIDSISRNVILNATKL